METQEASNLFQGVSEAAKFAANPIQEEFLNKEIESEKLWSDDERDLLSLIDLKISRHKENRKREVCIICVPYDIQNYISSLITLANDRNLTVNEAESLIKFGIKIDNDYRISNLLKEKLRNDKMFVLKAVMENGLAFKYASEKLRNDKEFVLAVLNQYGLALEHVSEELKNDKDVVMAAVEHGIGLALEHASEELKNNKEVVLAAVRTGGFALKYASEELKNNKYLVDDAVSYNGFALKYASEELKNDYDIVRSAVFQNRDALVYASEELQNCKHLVIQAIEDGYCLSRVSKELKNDKEVVLAAVYQDGFALEYVSEEVKNDKMFVLKAVMENGFALKYASERLRDDKEFILKAIKKGNWFTYVEYDVENAVENAVKNAVKNAKNCINQLNLSDRLLKDKEVIESFVKIIENATRYVYGLKETDDKICEAMQSKYGLKLDFELKDHFDQIENILEKICCLEEINEECNSDSYGQPELDDIIYLIENLTNNINQDENINDYQREEAMVIVENLKDMIHYTA